MSFGEEASSAHTYFLCRARQVIDGDQTTTVEDWSGINVYRALVYRWHRWFS